ncbi:MAG: hypothetical protein ACPL1A_09730 [Candidatus Kapaibacteriota bacterium]
MKISAKYLILLFIIISQKIIYSQERYIPIDSTNNIKTINQELEKNLGLFPEYINFQEAKLFQKNDSSFILEIYYTENGDLLKNRKEINEKQLSEIRAKIQEIISQKALNFNLNQEGRTFLITGTTLLSIYYGYAFGNLVNASDNVRGAIDLFTIGAGFFVLFYLTKNSEVTYGMSNLAVGAGAIGLGVGYCLNDLAHISFELNDQYILPTLTSVSGILGGYYYAKENKVTEGKANAIVAMSVLGSLYFAGISYAIIGDNMTNNQISGSFLLGSMGGALLGNTLSNKYDYAPGDAAVFSTSTLLATAETAALLAVMKTQDTQTAVGIMVLGATFGGLRGNYLASTFDYSSAEGHYVALGTIGGWLFGSGVCLLAFNKASDDALRFVPAVTVLFAELGFDITNYSITHKYNKDLGDNYNTRKLDFNFNPLGLTNNVREANKHLKNQIPFFNLSYQW